MPPLRLYSEFRFKSFSYCIHLFFSPKVATLPSKAGPGYARTRTSMAIWWCHSCNAQRVMAWPPKACRPSQVINDGLSTIHGMMPNFVETPDWSSLPRPTDDGAASHLLGQRMALVALPATEGRTVNLAALPGRVVVYAYPRTGLPEVPNPDGWDAIPGARGCTPPKLRVQGPLQRAASAGRVGRVRLVHLGYRLPTGSGDPPAPPFCLALG
jgi:hypothetical protein